MAGRVTRLQGWAEKECGWVPAVTLKNGAHIGLENALGRRLTDDEIAAIENEIASIRCMKTAYQKAEVMAQDVRNHLGTSQSCYQMKPLQLTGRVIQPLPRL